MPQRPAAARCWNHRLPPITEQARPRMNSNQLFHAIRKILGDRGLANLHALRYAYRLLRGHNREPEVALLPHLDLTGRVTVDVGAAGGDWSYALAKAVGPSGFVHAFEPQPYYATATRLALALLRRTNVAVHNLALGSSDHMGHLCIPIGPQGPVPARGYLLSRLDSCDERAHEEPLPVPVRRLDSLASGPKMPDLSNVALLKVDAEGYELLILQGAESLISSTRPYLILETGHESLHGHSRQDLYAFLSDHQYILTLMRVEAPLCTPLVRLLPESDVSPGFSANLVALPRERATGLLSKKEA